MDSSLKKADAWLQSGTSQQRTAKHAALNDVQTLARALLRRDRSKDDVQRMVNDAAELLDRYLPVSDIPRQKRNLAHVVVAHEKDGLEPKEALARVV